MMEVGHDLSSAIFTPVGIALFLLLTNWKYSELCGIIRANFNMI